ncbi:hypothetical protein PIB30_013680 [Stylosanthes scabra]|uniref:Uncharacterized protein n=1 Tax=Stylosanthes scabra TaxID=79078 RepID=A0ABU6W4H4_9FABA|nr:hypothetical protein [Stylosanthes scabra]
MYMFITSKFQHLILQKIHMHDLMTNTWCLCCPTPSSGRRSEKECNEQDSLCVKANVNEEYLEAFRTKSYIEICNKAQQGQLGTTILLSSNNNSPSSSTDSSSSSSSTLPFCKHLTEFLLDPRQENIAHMAHTTKLHHLLLNYFESTLEACHCCDRILQGLHSVRHSYRTIKRVLKISKMVLHNNGDQQQQQIQNDVIYRELASFAMHNNPLSIQFHHIHQRFMELLHRLRSKRVKIQRKLTWKKICKKLGGIGLVAAHSAVVVALLVFCFHSIVGLVAAPGILGGLVGVSMKRLFKGKNNKNGRIRRSSYCERLCEQLDVAARGVYIVINELKTVSRMVMRLHDEVEHRRLIARVCLSNYGKPEILRQVLRDLHHNQSSFLDQLDELEDHIYFCFLTINRSRSLLLQHITTHHI